MDATAPKETGSSDAPRRICPNSNFSHHCKEIGITRQKPF